MRRLHRTLDSRNSAQWYFAAVNYTNGCGFHHLRIFLSSSAQQQLAVKLSSSTAQRDWTNKTRLQGDRSSVHSSGLCNNDEEVDRNRLNRQDTTRGAYSAAVFNLMKTTIGSGIMTLPRALQLMGVLPGVGFIILVAAVMSFSLSILVAGATATREKTYFRSVEVLVGRRSAQVLQALIIMYTAGSTITNQIIIADVLIGAAAYPNGLLPLWLGPWEGAAAKMMMTRWFVLLVLMVTVIGPMCFTKRMSSLRYSSVVGVLLAIMFAFATLALACAAHSQGLVRPFHLFPRPLPLVHNTVAIQLTTNQTTNSTSAGNQTALYTQNTTASVANASNLHSNSPPSPVIPQEPVHSTDALIGATLLDLNSLGNRFFGTSKPGLSPTEIHDKSHPFQFMKQPRHKEHQTSVPSSPVGESSAVAVGSSTLNRWIRSWLLLLSPFQPNMTSTLPISVLPQEVVVTAQPASPPTHISRWESLVHLAQKRSDRLPKSRALSQHMLPASNSDDRGASKKGDCSNVEGSRCGDDYSSNTGSDSSVSVVIDSSSGSGSSSGASSSSSDSSRRHDTGSDSSDSSGSRGSSSSRDSGDFGDSGSKSWILQVGSMRKIQGLATRFAFQKTQVPLLPDHTAMAAPTQLPCSDEPLSHAESFATWLVRGTQPCTASTRNKDTEAQTASMEPTKNHTLTLTNIAGHGPVNMSVMQKEISRVDGSIGLSMGSNSGNSSNSSSSSSSSNSNSSSNHSSSNNRGSRSSDDGNINGLFMGSELPAHASGLELLVNVFSAMPVIVNSFVSHFNLHPIMNELAAPSPTIMVSVVETSNAVAALTYLVTAVAGYVTFADTTRENLLKNFEPTSLAPITGDFAAHLLSAFVRIGYAIVLLTSYPLVHFSLRARILEALDHATICKPIRHSSTDNELPEVHTLQLDHAEHRTAQANVAILGNVKLRPSSRQKAQLIPSGQNTQRQGVAIQSERNSFEHEDNEDSEQCSSEEARRMPGRRAGHPTSLSDSHHPSSTARVLSTHQDSHRGKRTPTTATSPSSPLTPLSQSQSHFSFNVRPAPNHLSSLSADARMTAANLNHWPDARRTRSPSIATYVSRLQCLCPGVTSICSSIFSLICLSVFASGARPVLIGVRCRRCGLCFATGICSCRTGVSRWLLVRTLNNIVSIALRILTWPWRVLTQPWPWHRLQHQTEHFWNQLTLITLIISYFAAIFIPDIWVVQRINGCTGAVAMSFVFPALMAMHLNPNSGRIKVMSVLLLLVGGTLVVGGLLLPLLPLPVPVPIAVSVLDDVAR